MQQQLKHPWNVSISQARVIQKTLSRKIIIEPLGKSVHTILGIDTAFDNTNNMCFTAAVLLSFPTLKKLEEKYVADKIVFPYIPGFLTFREGPSILKVLGLIKRKPDLLMFDGQGIAHPVKMGIAAHIGVLFNIPSIGCAKSRLFGTYSEVGKKRGDFSYLKDNIGKTIGVVLRTKDNTRPLFVSPGHLLDVKTSMEIILTSTAGYRLPEPTRLADKLSKKAKCMRN